MKYSVGLDILIVSALDIIRLYNLLVLIDAENPQLICGLGFYLNH